MCFVSSFEMHFKTTTTIESVEAWRVDRVITWRISSSPHMVYLHMVCLQIVCLHMVCLHMACLHLFTTDVFTCGVFKCGLSTHGLFTCGLLNDLFTGQMTICWMAKTVMNHTDEPHVNRLMDQ